MSTALSLLRDRSSEIGRLGTLLEGRKQSAETKVSALQAQVKELDLFAIKIDRVQKAFSALVDKRVKKDLELIDVLVTNGLRTVFPDREITFKSRPVEVGGKMQIDFVTEDNGKEISDDAYGSVSVVESLILRMICMNKMGTGKMLLLDETFSAIDNEYVTRVGVLLSEMAQQMGIDILLVSFNPGASDAAVLRATLNTKTRTLNVVKEGK